MFEANKKKIKPFDFSEGLEDLFDILILLRYRFEDLHIIYFMPYK